MDFIFLADKFYTEFEHSKYPEIEIKEIRPYILLLVKVRGLDFAIPLRSKIKHKYAYFTDLTDPVNKCGADYSKAVIIPDSTYIDNQKKPVIRPNEHKKLIGKSYTIRTEFEKYIRKYEKAVKNQQAPHNKIFCECSTLQYYHSELNI